MHTLCRVVVDATERSRRGVHQPLDCLVDDAVLLLAEHTLQRVSELDRCALAQVARGQLRQIVCQPVDVLRDHGLAARHLASSVGRLHQLREDIAHVGLERVGHIVRRDRRDDALFLECADLLVDRRQHAVEHLRESLVRLRVDAALDQRCADGLAHSAVGTFLDDVAGLDAPRDSGNQFLVCGSVRQRLTHSLVDDVLLAAQVLHRDLAILLRHLHALGVEQRVEVLGIPLDLGGEARLQPEVAHLVRRQILALRHACDILAQLLSSGRILPGLVDEVADLLGVPTQALRLLRRTVDGLELLDRHVLRVADPLRQVAERLGSLRQLVGLTLGTGDERLDRVRDRLVVAQVVCNDTCCMFAALVRHQRVLGQIGENIFDSRRGIGQRILAILLDVLLRVLVETTYDDLRRLRGVLHVRRENVSHVFRHLHAGGDSVSYLLNLRRHVLVRLLADPLRASAQRLGTVDGGVDTSMRHMRTDTVHTGDGRCTEEARGGVLADPLRVHLIVRVVRRAVRLVHDFFRAFADAFQRHVAEDARDQRLLRTTCEGLVHHRRRGDSVRRRLQPADDVRPQRPLTDTHTGGCRIFVQLCGLIAGHNRVDRQRAAHTGACRRPRGQRLARQTGTQPACQPSATPDERACATEQHVGGDLPDRAGEVVDAG